MEDLLHPATKVHFAHHLVRKLTLCQNLRCQGIGIAVSKSKDREFESSELLIPPGGDVRRLVDEAS